MTAFDDFVAIKNEMEVFTELLDSKISAKRSDIIQSKQQCEINLNNLLNQQSNLKNEIKNLNLKVAKIKDSIKKSLENLQFQQLKVDDLKSKQTDLLEKRDLLQEEQDSLSAQIKELTEKLNKTQEDLNLQQLIDYPELIKYELYLGLRIDVVTVDLLRFIFNNVLADDLDKEIWCELSVGGENYKLGDTFPKLPLETIQLIENDFNGHKEFVKFLKTIRMTLKEELES